MRKWVKDKRLEQLRVGGGPHRGADQWNLGRGGPVYTSDAADEEESVDVGCHRLMPKPNDLLCITFTAFTPH